MDAKQLQTALLDTHDDYQSAHQEAEWAYAAWQERKSIFDAAYTAELGIATALKDRDGKPVYANAQARETAARAAVETNYPSLTAELEASAQTKAETAARAERLLVALKTYRAALAYEVAALEHETAETQAASMPRIVRR